jgi:hypothetical protein
MASMDVLELHQFIAAAHNDFECRGRELLPWADVFNFSHHDCDT